MPRVYRERRARLQWANSFLRRSTSRRIIAVKISGMARSIFPPGTTRPSPAVGTVWATLRADVVHVLVHAAQDHFGHRVGRITARALVAEQFARRQRLPGREGAGRLIERRGFFVVVPVLAADAGATFGAAAEQRLFLEQISVFEVVPAPDEPVIAMMGCLADMGRLDSGVRGAGVRPSSRTGRGCRTAASRKLRAVRRGGIARCARPPASSRTRSRCAGAALRVSTRCRH